MPIKGYK